MHVLLIHQLFATGDEAGGTRHFEIARRWVAAGDQVTVATSPENYLTSASTPPPEGLPAGLKVVRVGAASALASAGHAFAARVAIFLRFAVAALRAGLRVRGVDAVWGTTPPIFQAPTAWAVARLKGVPFVLEVRDLWPDFAVGLGVLRNRAAIRAAKAMERFLYRRADLVVVNSPGFVEHVRREGGVDPVVVANGVDTAPFIAVEAAGDRAGVRRKLGWEGRFATVYAGAHGVPNDLEVVLRAAELAQAARQERILFVFVGSGRDLPRLRRLAEKWKLANVQFLGPRPKSEMPAILAAADCCIAILKPIPMFTTTYPNKVFDYMAAARPVVLAIDGAIREVVEGAGAGLFAQPGDPAALLQAVRSYRADPARAARDGAAGRAAVMARYHRDGQAAQMREAVAGVVAGADDRRRAEWRGRPHEGAGR